MTFAYFSSEKSRAPAASRTGYAFAKGSATPTGEMKLSPWFVPATPQSRLRRASSPYTGEPLGRCDAEGEMKLGHSLYRQSLRHGYAVPPPFAQGRLEVSATPHSLHKGGFWLAVLLKYHIAVITLSKNGILKKDFFCVTNN